MEETITIDDRLGLPVKLFAEAELARKMIFVVASSIGTTGEMQTKSEVHIGQHETSSVQK